MIDALDHLENAMPGISKISEPYKVYRMGKDIYFDIDYGEVDWEINSYG